MLATVTDTFVKIKSSLEKDAVLRKTVSDFVACNPNGWTLLAEVKRIGIEVLRERGDRPTSAPERGALPSPGPPSYYSELAVAGN